MKVWKSGGRITEDDLLGISDVETLSKWKRLVNSGLTSGDKNATTWIAGQVSQYTQDATLETAKSNPLWIAVNQQALRITEYSVDGKTLDSSFEIIGKSLRNRLT